MTKYLILGNGLLGTSFGKRENTVVLSKEECDITLEEDVLRAINEFSPDVVVNCAGIVPKNRVNVKQLFKINSFAPHSVAGICWSHGCKFVHISTNCVFDGVYGNYSEKDTPNAIDVYGASKLLGEPEDTLVIRTSFVGLPDPKGRGLLAWAQGQKEIVGYDKVLWNGVTTNELVSKIREFVDIGITGVRHVHGFTLSKYRLLCAANDILFDGQLNIHQESQVTDTPHIEDKTLMTEYSGGYVTKSIEEQLKEL